MKRKHKDISDLKIREFRIGDYDALISLWKEAKLPFRPKGRDSRERIKREFEFGDSIFLIAELDGRLIGSILGTHDGRKGWINRLAVADEYREHGIARRLTTEVEARFYRMGIEVIACLMEDWNRTSIKAFKKMGYKKYSGIIYLSKRTHPEA